MSDDRFETVDAEILHRQAFMGVKGAIAVLGPITDSEADELLRLINRAKRFSWPAHQKVRDQKESLLEL